MADEGVHTRIEELVAEEHELYERAAEGGLSESEHRRLDAIKVGLDQCWDLLRQRRALREAGRDPDAARATRTSSSATSSEHSGCGPAEGSGRAAGAAGILTDRDAAALPARPHVDPVRARAPGLQPLLRLACHATAVARAGSVQPVLPATGP